MDELTVSGRGLRLLVGAIVILVLVVVVQAVLLIVLAVDDSEGEDGSASPLGVAPAIPPIPVGAAAVDGEVGVPEEAGNAASVSPGSIRYVTYLAEHGFAPERLEIEVGETVAFVNASGGDFWPASNIHPTHEILHEFDSLGPVPSGQAWEFVFDEAGQWQYHDHLNPSEGGVIIALEAVAAEPGAEDGVGEVVEGETGTGDLGLRDELEPLVIEMPDIEFAGLPGDAAARYSGIYTDDGELERFIGEFGPSNALRVLKAIETETSGDCHNRAHEVGRIAYELFGPAAFALASHECQSGGFHGTTEALFASRGTANLAEDVAALCSDAPNPFIRHQCLHGIGHGIMAWANYELHQSLELCDAIPESLDKQSCYSGVFMENVVGGLSGLMGHTTEYLRPDDPVYPCDVVADRYRADCYFYQTSHMVRVLGYDMAAVAQLCAEAPAGSASHCFGSYGRDAASFAQNDPAASIVYCGYAPTAELNAACTRGAVQNGFWEKPGAPRAIQHCALLDNDPQSHEVSREVCYQTIITRARDVFQTAAEHEQFCVQLPADRHAACRQTLGL